jgi:hypothetical protein
MIAVRPNRTEEFSPSDVVSVATPPLFTLVPSWASAPEEDINNVIINTATVLAVVLTKVRLMRILLIKDQ